MSEVPLSRRIFSQPGSHVKTIDYRDPTHGVHAKGVIVVVAKGAITPREANGVILRLNNVGIGTYSRFGLVGQPTIRQRITGEIHILKGLHDALNAPRDRFAGPAYDLLYKYVTDALTNLSREGYADWEGRKDREKKRREKEREKRYKEAHATKQRERRTGGARRSASTSASSARSNGHESRESTGSIEEDSFADPVIELRVSTGTMRVDETHELFKKYSRKSEGETIRLVLRALKLANLPESTYRRIIEALIAVK